MGIENTVIEEKKQYLKSYEKAVRQIERREERIREIRQKEICPSMSYSGMPASHNTSDLSEYASVLDEEERKYRKERYKKLSLCREISDKIEQMENEDEKDVLMNRYIKLMKWEDICLKMCCSWKQVHRIHKRALNNFKLFKHDID